MADSLLSAQRLLDRFGHEELELKKLGLMAQAAGMRVAITLLIKEVQAAKDLPSPTNSSPKE